MSKDLKSSDKGREVEVMHYILCTSCSPSHFNSETLVAPSFAARQQYQGAVAGISVGLATARESRPASILQL
jgi:hypothetical protein